MTTPLERRWRTRGVFASIGAGTLIIVWMILLPSDFSSPGSSGRITAGLAMTVLVSAVAAGGVAFAGKVSGQAFVVGAYVMTLVLFTYRGITADDPLWIVGLLVVGLVALGAFVTAFALGRLLRTGSTMT